jgi:hypothetical protein
MDNLFATHPSTANRIAALQQLAAQMGVDRFDQPRTAPNPRASSGPWGNARQRRPSRAATGHKRTRIWLRDSALVAGAAVERA